MAGSCDDLATGWRIGGGPAGAVATGGGNALTAGFEVSTEKSRNQLRAITAGTPTDLFDPDPRRPWDGTVVDLPGEVVHAKADTVAAYIFDTANIGRRWQDYYLTLYGLPDLSIATSSVSNDKTVQTTPNPVGQSNDLYGVSCASATACTAVGY